jgi:hypothetical protein
LNKCKNEPDTLPEPISLTLEEAMQVTGGAGTGSAGAGTIDLGGKSPIVIYGIVAPEWKLNTAAAPVNAVKAG